jgi:hypothetical protein
VDAADVLIAVDAPWLAFARENGAADLDERAVLGRSLWDFVAGDGLCALYREIHSRVRSRGVPVVLPFRCDSPSLQRHMRLKITRANDAHLEYESVLERVVPQGPFEILDPTRPRSHAMLTLCSCCKRALLEPVGWLELEDVSVRLRLFETKKVPELRHTLCPECVDTLKKAADNGNAA